MCRSIWQRSSRALGTLACSSILAACGAGDEVYFSPVPAVEVPRPEPDAGGAGRGSTPIDAKKPDGGRMEPDAGDAAVDHDAGADAEPPVVCDDVDVEAARATDCGDGVFEPDVEECDDGNVLDGDGCDARCRVEEIPLVGMAADAPGEGGRRLGAGRHAIATGCGIALAYVDGASDGSQRIGRARLSRYGALLDVVPDVSAGTVPAAEPDPVIAELPDFGFAVAFTDDGGDGDGLGIALRRASADAAGELVRVNATTIAAQRDPDMVWTGSELAIAWLDLSNPMTAPDLRYRVFGADLRPSSEERTLADGLEPESAVGLAAFRDSFAAAWRTGSGGGLERIDVRAGETRWTVGPFLAGPAGERPALVALDDERLLVVFTETLELGVARISAAVLERGAPGDAPWFELAPEAFGAEPLLEQTQPSALVAGDRLFVAWRGATPPGGELAEELWLKEVPISSAEGGGLVLELGVPEIALPRSAALRLGDQRFPALAAVSAARGTSIAAAWVDLAWGLSAGTGRSTVMVELLPLPIARHTGGEQG